MSGYTDTETLPMPPPAVAAAPLAAAAREAPGSAGAGIEAAGEARAAGAPPAQQVQAAAQAGAAEQAPGAIQANAPGPDGTTPQGSTPGYPQPPITRDAFVEAVTRFGESPTGAMVTAGAMAPPQQRGPGDDPARLVPQLTRDVVQSRGPERTGPLTRQDWDTHLQTLTRSALRNLGPQEQVQALAAIDRVRTAGMQRFASLAVASAQAGDAEGAARALNGANNYMPDGFNTTFQAGPGGLVMTRRPESGNGPATTATVPLNQVTRYATAMLSPTWSLEHFLAVDRHNETVRHNVATEGIARDRNAISASAGADRRRERREDRDNDSAAARTAAQYDDASTAYDNVRNDPNATPEQRQQAQERRDTAHAAWREAQSRASSRGVATSESIVGRGDQERQRAEQTRHTRGREGDMTEQQTRRFDAAAEDYNSNNTPRGQTRPSETARRVVDTAERIQGLNPSASPRTTIDMVDRWQRRDPTIVVDPQSRTMRDTGTGRVLRMPPPAASRPSVTTPTRPAPTE